MAVSSIIGNICGVPVSDSNIVSSTLSISMSTCGSSFTFGTFNAAQCKITINTDALETDFMGGTIRLTKTARGDDSTVTTSLGKYWIDDSKVKRSGKKVSLVGYDAAVLFDVEIDNAVKQTTYTPITAVQAACTAVGVGYAGYSGNSPNTEVTFTPSSESIQSYRDLVMWAVQLLGANAVINRAGLLEIRPALRASSETDYTNTAKMRQDIQFSDAVTKLVYLTAYSNRQPKTYSLSSSSDGIPASVSLPLNPLLDDKTEAECDAINQAILSSVAYRGLRGITAKAVDDPSVSLGVPARFKGGKVDAASSVVGIVTGIVWRYRGVTTITCTTPTSVKENDDNA